MLVFFYTFDIEEGTLLLKDSRFVEASKGRVVAKLDVVELNIVELNVVELTIVELDIVKLDVVGYNRAYKEGIRELIIDIVISIVSISIVDMFSKEVIVL